jgi:hypothetical protein
MAEDSTDLPQKTSHKRMPFLAKVLAVILVVMFILFFLQWYLITELFSFAADLMKSQLIQQAPDGVDAAAIRATFSRVEQAMQAMPLSYLRGQVRLRKVKIAIDYASKANEDGVWSAEEINTLLKMTDAAVGYRGKEQ